MENRFDFLDKEEKIYKNWEKNGYFKPQIDKSKKPFVISMPPPNVTAKLHIGHALDNTLQDVFVRYHRLKGEPTLWIPGTDHASIATEVKVVAKLKEEGKTKDSIGRDAFLKEAWEWKEKYGGEITSQLRKIGASCDWSRERFTMDEGCSKAVLETFERLYNKGLIYKGERIVNWCPDCKTPISETEVEYEEQNSYLWHIKYKLEDSDEYLVVATTRPETMLGDTAVAVNPNDERYKHLVGKRVFLPIVEKYIPIIEDRYVDLEFGTGVVKMTPAHDPNDFEVGKRHNLEFINILNDDGTLNENAGIYEGLTTLEARKQIEERLQKEGYLLKKEEYTHNVGSCYRCHHTIEPYISNQWFVKMKELVKPAIEAVKTGEVEFVPKRFEKTYFNWMENIQDWCISRQLWWGHRIPAWYRGEEIYVGMDKPDGEGWIQDEDVLDTWFSSALWPFATLGWPDNTSDLERYYPNNCLVTGYDIIPFWVNRMTFQGEELLGERPFEDCLIHGLIRDKQGRKFSKSLGNGIDPFDMIRDYGADALRYYLATDVASGTDMRFDEEKIKATWNFINKVWNASRFVLTNIEGLDEIVLDDLKPEDMWILTKFERTLEETRKFMDKYEFNNAGSTIYNFTWTMFCDNYIEMAKYTIDSKSTKSVLCYVLDGILKLLHPFMPYVTEEIYGMLPVRDSESIMISKYPRHNKKLVFEDIEDIVDDEIEFIKNFRNIKAENNISKEFKVMFDTSDDNDLIIKMLKLKDNVVKDNLGIKAYKVFSKKVRATIFFEKVETEADKALKLAQIEMLRKSIQRRKNLLSNEGYVTKAPQNIVEQERKNLALEEEKLKNLELDNK